MKFTPELLKGSTKTLILSTLSEGELYGYQIVKAIRKHSNDMLEIGEGSMYPALHSLEKDKYVASVWKEVNGRDRKYYTLTPKGRRSLKEYLKEWKTFSQAVNSVVKHVDTHTYA